MPPTEHMTPEEFRRLGHQVIDWIAGYWERLGEFPVLSQVQPGDVRAALPASPPLAGEPFDGVLADLDRAILPGVTHWQAPGFFAFFPANASGPAVLGDLVSAGLGVQGMLWATSPAATELETHVMDWLAELLDLPADFRSTGTGGGVIQDSASSSTLVAVLAARERITRPDSANAGNGAAANDTGTPGDLVAYTSTEAHSSVEKALRIAGIGSRRLRLVAVDPATSRMDAGALAEAMAADVAAGLRPFFVCATIGTTGVTAVDPLPELGPVCREYGAWLHVDAAEAGAAAVCPEFRWLHDGLEYADSYVFDPHKWLLTNFDCSAFFVRDRAALIQALSITPEYLRNQASESGEVIDYRDWQVPLGRRFRSLKLWFVLRWYGAEGLRVHVRHGVDLAAEFEKWVDGDSSYQVVSPRTLNLVAFAHTGGDAATQRMLDQVNASGRAYLTATRLGDRLVARMAIGGTLTTREHVERAWQLIRSAA